MPPRSHANHPINCCAIPATAATRFHRWVVLALVWRFRTGLEMERALAMYGGCTVYCCGATARVSGCCPRQGGRTVRLNKRRRSLPSLMAALMCRICRVGLVANSDGHECPSCGSSWHFIGEVLTLHAATLSSQSGASEAFFDRYHDQHGGSSSSALPWWCQLETLEPDRVIRQVVASTRPRVVVELGCGTGSNLAIIQSVHSGESCLIGCDVSFKALTRAQEALRNHPNTSDLLLVHSDGANLPLEPGFADLVILINVLHHATDLSLVGDAARLVRPGGTVLIIDLSAGNFLYNLSRFFWNYLPISLRRRFDHDLLVNDEAPQVRLVDLNDLALIARQHGLSLELYNSKGLFLFTFQYACMLFPAVARFIPRVVWLGLAALERGALSVPFLAARSAGFSVRYRMVPIALSEK